MPDLEGRLERLGNAMAQRESSEETQLQLQLPPWPEHVRGTPNAFIRSALFPAISPARRRFLKNEVLASTKGLTVRFTGEQFSQSDLDVWEHAVHLAREQPLGRECSFTAHNFLKALRQPTGKSQKDWLKEVFRRLKACSVEITYNDITYAGSLVDEYYRDERTQAYAILLNSKLHRLFDAGYTGLGWRQRQQLRKRSLAGWVFNFLSSHREPFPFTVTRYHELSGSNTKSMRRFRQSLGTALDKLVEIGFLESWRFEDELVHVRRAATAVIEHEREAPA